MPLYTRHHNQLRKVSCRCSKAERHWRRVNTRPLGLGVRSCRCSKAERHWRPESAGHVDCRYSVADARKPKGIGDSVSPSVACWRSSLQMLESRKALATHCRGGKTDIRICCRCSKAERHWRLEQGGGPSAYNALQMLESRKALATNFPASRPTRPNVADARKPKGIGDFPTPRESPGKYKLQMLESRKALATARTTRASPRDKSCRCSKAERHWRQRGHRLKIRRALVADARKPKGIGDSVSLSVVCSRFCCRCSKAERHWRPFGRRTLLVLTLVADARKPKGIGDKVTFPELCNYSGVADARKPKGIGDLMVSIVYLGLVTLQMLESRKALATIHAARSRLGIIRLQMLESRKALATPKLRTIYTWCPRLQMLESRKALATMFFS